MEVDGTPASRPGKKYGIHFAAVTIMPGIANVLPYYIWLTELDTEHAVQIPSPTRTAMVITNPTIKGLELHLTAGTTITGYDGKPCEPGSALRRRSAGVWDPSRRRTGRDARRREQAPWRRGRDGSVEEDASAAREVERGEGFEGVGHDEVVGCEVAEGDVELG